MSNNRIVELTGEYEGVPFIVRSDSANLGFLGYVQISGSRVRNLEDLWVPGGITFGPAKLENHGDKLWIGFDTISRHASIGKAVDQCIELIMQTR